MAARKHTAALPSTIKKIKCSLYINALQDHILGKKHMTTSQVTAALGLIRKVIPDLAAVQLDGKVDHDIQIRWRS